MCNLWLFFSYIQILKRVLHSGELAPMVGRVLTGDSNLKDINNNFPFWWVSLTGLVGARWGPLPQLFYIISCDKVCFLDLCLWCSFLFFPSKIALLLFLFLHCLFCQAQTAGLKLTSSHSTPSFCSDSSLECKYLLFFIFLYPIPCYSQCSISHSSPT